MRSIKAKRVVVKIGTNILCKKDGTVDRNYIDDIARQLVELGKKKIQSIIVTSGAIGTGSAELSLDGRQKSIAEKQACAAVGQPAVMLAYHEAFKKYGKSVGQVLLTYGAFSDRKRYLDLRRTIDELFSLGAIPIVNENDVISTDEIEESFGDNDKLSALVASKIDADLLLMLTDVDGLYDRNPEIDSNAKLISEIDEVTKDIERMAGTRKNERSVGGMKTKLAAAKIAMQSGISLIIANGRTEDVIVRAVGGDDIGTLFTPKRKYSNKERWILFGSPRGKIFVDSGAEKALRDGKSLLPWGIDAVEGKFKEGDIVRIDDFAKGVTNYSSTELTQLKENCLNERKAGLQKAGNKVVIDSENIMIIE